MTGRLGAGQEADDNALKFMSRVRWMGAIFTVAQFALYQPPAGREVPFAQVPTGLALAAVMVALNLVLALLARNGDSRRRRQVVLIGLVCDAVVICCLVWLFGFDGTSATWALLVIPVLEGALAAQMVGALAMWSALTVFYTVREAANAARYEWAWFEVPSITFRMGVVLIVAVTAGSLARSLTREAAAQRRAKVMFEERAALLHGLAVSSRSLFATRAKSDVASVWDAIVQCVMDVGFEAASICVFEPDRDAFLVACGRGLPDGYIGSSQHRDKGMAGVVATEQRTVVVEDYSALPGAMPELRMENFGSCIGVPIRGFDGGVDAVLMAGVRRRGPMPASQVEYIELLAVHAAVALSNLEQIAERARHERELHKIAYSDSLTGLPNRSRFVSALREAMADGAPARDVTVLFFDVDRFKSVNDSLGHNGGDEVLQTMATRIAGCIRPGDTLARLSGDEFALLLRDTPHAEVERLVEQILARLGASLRVADVEVVVTASIGIATTTAGAGVLPSELLSQADTAMYAAKRSGGARHRWFGPELQEDTARRLRIRTDLQGALDRGELSVAYQPVWHLARRRIVGVEALLRWEHPTAGSIAPDEFIPVAEDSGAIVDIGRWILREATAQVAQWERETGHALQLGVNFSARQLAHPALVGDIAQALDDAGLRPEQLVFEITESVMVDDVEHNAAVLNALHATGVRLAVDDFGTGYSSLSYLRRFPVDVIKIDRSFVQLLDTTEDSATLPRAILELARTLDLDVCAEGIERGAQLDALLRLGCVFGQGYLLGHPGPAAILDALLAEQLLPATSVG